LRINQQQHASTKMHAELAECAPGTCRTQQYQQWLDNSHAQRLFPPHQIRDTDLDTLERLVSCLTWGDIEAEDSRHLAESSFVKVFRLAQLLLEYLLYVQDSLKHTNSALELSRYGTGGSGTLPWQCLECDLLALCCTVDGNMYAACSSRVAVAHNMLRSAGQ
jgi:hypothetical protein